MAAFGSPLMGYFENRPGMDLLTKTSTEGFNKMLSDYMKIYKGEMSPTDLPMYKNFAGSLETMFAKATPDIMREATARGIRGGSLANILQSGHTDLIEKSVKAMYDMYSQAPEGIAKTFGSMAGLDQQSLQTMLGFYAKEKDRESQEKIAKMGQISQAGSGWTQGKCCFIFIEGERLTDNVRNLRDKMFPKGGVIEKGYRRMARWLVPRMARNWFIKEIVRATMLNPICLVADCHYGYNSYGWMFVPVAKFWAKICERLGRNL